MEDTRIIAGYTIVLDKNRNRGNDNNHSNINNKAEKPSNLPREKDPAIQTEEKKTFNILDFTKMLNDNKDIKDMKNKFDISLVNESLQIIKLNGYNGLTLWLSKKNKGQIIDDLKKITNEIDTRIEKNINNDNRMLRIRNEIIYNILLILKYRLKGK